MSLFATVPRRLFPRRLGSLIYMRGSFSTLVLVSCLLVGVLFATGLNEERLSHVEGNSLSLESSSKNDPNSGYGVWFIGDVHYDPYYDAHGAKGQWCRGGEKKRARPYGRFSCDAPWELVSSAFDFIADHQEPDDIIFVSGDWSAHGMPDADAVLDAIDVCTKGLIDSVGPNTRVIPVVGNNDVHPHYTMECGSPDYDHWRRLGDIWSPWLSGEAFDIFTEEGRGGYFGMTIEPGVRVLSINSNLWAPRLKPETSDPDPCGMKEWMLQELTAAAAEGMKVWITGHIPPGLRGNLSGMEFKAEHAKWFTEFVNAFSDTITLQMFAHTHMDSFRLLDHAASSSSSSSSKHPAVLQSPSISPVNGNNPGVRRMQFDGAGAPMDYVQYYADLWESNINESIEWKTEYIWSDVYGAYLSENGKDGLSPTAMAELFETLLGNNEAFARWMAHRMVSRVEDRNKYYCQLSVVNNDDLDACLDDAREDLERAPSSNDHESAGDAMDEYFSTSGWWQSEDGQRALNRAAGF